MKNIIGKRVQLAREQHTPRLTQEALAIRLQLIDWTNCSRFTISKIELGTRTVTDHEVQMLSQALGVSPNWLFGAEK